MKKTALYTVLFVLPLISAAQDQPAEGPAETPQSPLELDAAAVSQPPATRFHNFEMTLTGSRNDRISAMVSEPVKAEGTASEIIVRAQACVAKNVRNESIEISGSNSASFLGSLASQTSDHRQRIEAGPMIELAQPESGLLIANSRSDYTAMMMGYNVRTKLTIEAKDGRFRITAGDLQSLAKSAGTASNKGYREIIKQWGMGWEPAITAVKNTTDKITACIVEKPGGDW